MAYLLSDAAQGSTAVRTMQQNYYGAEFDKQNIAEAAKQQQLKTQEEAAKVKQTEVNTQHLQLQNILAESAIQVDADAKAAVATLEKSAGWGEKSTSDKTRAMAEALMGKNPIEAGKLLDAASKFDLRAEQEKAKELDNNTRQIGQATAALEGATPEQIPEILKRMTPQQHKLIEAQIPGFFEETDPKLQHSQLKALMLNASGQNLAMKIQADHELERMREEAKKEVARIQAAGALAVRTAGGSSKLSGEELKAYNSYSRASSKIDLEYKGQLKDAEDAVKAAEREVNAYRWYSFSTKEGTKSAYDDAVRGRNDLNATITERKLAELELLPEGKQKDLMHEKLMKNLESYKYGTGKPDSEDTPPPKKDKPSPGTEGAISTTGNAYISPEVKALIEADAKKEGIKDPKIGRFDSDTPGAVIGVPPKTTATRESSGKIGGVGTPVSTKDVAKTGDDFDKKWANLKPGESLVGPDGKTYKKK